MYIKHHFDFYFLSFLLFKKHKNKIVEKFQEKVSIFLYYNRFFHCILKYSWKSLTSYTNFQRVFSLIVSYTKKKKYIFFNQLNQ